MKVQGKKGKENYPPTFLYHTYTTKNLWLPFYYYFLKHQHVKIRRSCTLVVIN